VLSTGGLVITLSTWLANTTSHFDIGHIATKLALVQLPLALSVKLVVSTHVTGCTSF